MRILLILGSLIAGTIAGIFLFGMIWRSTAPEGTMAMVVGGGTPIVFGAWAYLGTKMGNGRRPSLGSAQTWMALLGIALRRRTLRVGDCGGLRVGAARLVRL